MEVAKLEGQYEVAAQQLQKVEDDRAQWVSHHMSVVEDKIRYVHMLCPSQAHLICIPCCTASESRV